MVDVACSKTVSWDVTLMDIDPQMLEKLLMIENTYADRQKKKTKNMHAMHMMTIIVI